MFQTPIVAVKEVLVVDMRIEMTRWRPSLLGRAGTGGRGRGVLQPQLSLDTVTLH